MEPARTPEPANQTRTSGLPGLMEGITPAPLSGNVVGPSLKAGKPLFERGDGDPKIVPALRQRRSEDRISGNVLVEKLGASIEIADECTDPCHFP